MKLKKIASLMLAGIMAVSMLAACKSGSNNNNNNNSSSSQPVSNASTVMQGALSEKAALKITFSANSKLDTALMDAVGHIGAPTIDGYYGDMHAVQDASELTASNELKEVVAELGAKERSKAFGALIPEADDDMNETVRILYIANSAVEVNSAVKQIAADISDSIENMQVDNDVVTPAANDATVNYTYTGSVSTYTKTLTEDHGKSLTFIAVEINRVAHA